MCRGEQCGGCLHGGAGTEICAVTASNGGARKTVRAEGSAWIAAGVAKLTNSEPGAAAHFRVTVAEDAKIHAAVLASAMIRREMRSTRSMIREVCDASLPAASGAGLCELHADGKPGGASDGDGGVQGQRGLKRGGRWRWRRRFR